MFGSIKNSNEVAVILLFQKYKNGRQNFWEGEIFQNR